jgi:diguanylate cyclase (GGDEF)-like protein
MTFSPGEGISGIVAKTGQWVLIPDTSKDTRYLHYKGRHLTDGSFLCVPIRLHDRLIGLFNVLRPRVGAFSDGDIRLLTSLANYAALAIANAQLHGRITVLSVTDELTGLSNRRHLLQEAEREMERSSRLSQPLSCLMIDIDHFKRFNDTHGHLRGDVALTSVAKTIGRGVRKMDLVARYGGEEFVVMLPGIGKGEAVKVGEKLRAAVAKETFDTPLTLSVGVAACSEDASTLADLLAASDYALFAAKRAGRNRVASYDPDMTTMTLPEHATATAD